MKKNLVLLLLAGSSFFSSCKKESAPSLTQPTDKTPGKTAVVNLLNQPQLTGFSAVELPANFVADPQIFSDANNATQLISTFSGPDNDVHVTIADLGNCTQSQRDNYLAGKCFPTGTWISSFSEAGSSPVSAFAVDGFTGDGAVEMVLEAAPGNPGLFNTSLIPQSDGSFITPYMANPGQSVAGWKMYDASTHVGYVILLVANRFAVVVDGNGQYLGIDFLNGIVNQINFAGLELLAEN